MAVALPPDGDNPIGTTARNWILDKVRTATPGVFTYPSSWGPRPFRTIFFPNVNFPYEKEIETATGLNLNFWSGLAVACLCQQMYTVTSTTKKRINIDKVLPKIAASNSQLKPRLINWYAFVAAKAKGDIATALAKFPAEADRKMAKEHYITGLTSLAWINKKLAQDASGNWTNRDWELFHHWIKLKALGATDQEIDETITKATALGLPIPAELSAGQWLNWSNWMTRRVEGSDFSDANGPIFEKAPMRSMTVFLTTYIGEGNSLEFVYEKQPGRIYWKDPLMSCFAPGTKVVMADGLLKDIEKIEKGELVKSVNGDRKVVFKSAPLRKDRDLFQIDQLDFAFTGSHPFIIYQKDSRTRGTFAAADPGQLIAQVPTLSQSGVRSLRSPNPPDLIRYQKEGAIAYTPKEVCVDKEAKPTVLYDLILDMGEDGISEYFVGDEKVQVLVSSEIPRFLEAPEVTHCVLIILEHCASAILKAFASVSDEDFNFKLDRELYALSQYLLPGIGLSLTTAIKEQNEIDLRSNFSKAKTLQKVNGFLNALSADNDLGYHRRTGILLELFSARFAPQFQAAISLGWRSFNLSSLNGGTLLAVSVYSIEIFGTELDFSTDQAEVEIKLSKGKAVYSKVIPVVPESSLDHSFYRVDEVSYFPEWRAEIDPEKITQAAEAWNIDISLQSKIPKKESPLQAHLILPRKIEKGYDSFFFPMYDEKGIAIGSVHLDVRTLNVNGLAEELTQKKKWKKDKEAAFAHLLTEKATKFILDIFEKAVH